MSWRVWLGFAYAIPILALMYGFGIGFDKIVSFIEQHEKLLTVLSTTAIAWFTYTLWRATTGLQNVAKNELISSHRPKIRVRNIVVRQPRPVYAAMPPLFAQDCPVSGQFYISNVGGSPAKVTAIGCWVHLILDKNRAHRDILPMERPYEGKNLNILLTPTLKAGESFPIPFQSDEPLTHAAAHNLNTGTGDFINGTWRLYVMGFIEYFDDIGTPRRTNFCREFSPEMRFVKVDNEDYERED